MPSTISVQTARANFSDAASDCSAFIAYSEYSLRSSQRNSLCSSRASIDGMGDLMDGEGDVDLLTRITTLETQVSHQADEILTLRSALADAVRRLDEVEASSNRRPNTAPIISNSRPTTASKGFTSSQSCLSLQDAPYNRHSNGDCSNLFNKSNGISSVSNESLDYLSNRRSRSATRKTTKSPGQAMTASRSAAPLLSAPPSAAKGKRGTTPDYRKSMASSDAGGSRPNSVQGTVNKRIGSKNVTIDKVALKWKPGEGHAKMYLKGRAVTVYAPTEYTRGQLDRVGKSPKEDLVLDWVLGYRGRDARNNIFVVSTGEICYFVAGVVVLYNAEEHTQRHYTEHTDDVKSFALHPDKITVASGQVAGHSEKEGKPHIRIWNALNLQTSRVIGEGDFGRAVCCLSFSIVDTGILLAAVDESNEHAISIWNWSDSKKLIDQKGSQDPVTDVQFHPSKDNCIIMCGKNQLIFWTYDGEKLTKKSGLFERYEKPKFVLCLAFDDEGLVITGDSNGNIFFWSVDEHKIKGAITEAHDGGVFSLYCKKDGCLLSGGKDGRINLFDSNRTKIQEITKLGDNFGGVRLLTMSNESQIIVGTTRNSILEGTRDSPEFSILAMGHSEELWGISINPNDDRFMTCGLDKTIIYWDKSTKRPLWMKQVEYGCMSCALHPSSPVAVIGTDVGRWFAMDLEKREVITMHTESKEQFDCISFSPDGTMVALGSHDNGIYIYKVHEGGRRFAKIGKCLGHTSYVTHLDWSCDGQYLVSNSGDYEVLYWTANNCKQCLDVQSMRDVAWDRQSCVLGYSVIGIWPEGADGTDINSADRSSDHNFVATSDDFGFVKLFNYPCYTPRAAFKAGRAHSSHVTRVRFFNDSRTLATTGGQDTAIMLWRIE